MKDSYEINHIKRNTSRENNDYIDEDDSKKQTHFNNILDKKVSLALFSFVRKNDKDENKKETQNFNQKNLDIFFHYTGNNLPHIKNIIDCKDNSKKLDKPLSFHYLDKSQSFNSDIKHIKNGFRVTNANMTKELTNNKSIIEEEIFKKRFIKEIRENDKKMKAIKINNKIQSFQNDKMDTKTKKLDNLLQFRSKHLLDDNCELRKLKPLNKSNSYSKISSLTNNFINKKENSTINKSSLLIKELYSSELKENDVDKDKNINSKLENDIDKDQNKTKFSEFKRMEEKLIIANKIMENSSKFDYQILKANKALYQQYFSIKIRNKKTDNNNENKNNIKIWSMKRFDNSKMIEIKNIVKKSEEKSIHKNNEISTSNNVNKNSNSQNNVKENEQHNDHEEEELKINKIDNNALNEYQKYLTLQKEKNKFFLLDYVKKRILKGKISKALQKHRHICSTFSNNMYHMNEILGDFLLKQNIIEKDFVLKGEGKINPFQIYQRRKILKKMEKYYVNMELIEREIRTKKQILKETLTDKEFEMMQKNPNYFGKLYQDDWAKEHLFLKITKEEKRLNDDKKDSDVFINIFPGLKEFALKLYLKDTNASGTRKKINLKSIVNCLLKKSNFKSQNIRLKSQFAYEKEKIAKNNNIIDSIYKKIANTNKPDKNNKHINDNSQLDVSNQVNQLNKLNLNLRGIDRDLLMDLNSKSNSKRKTISKREENIENSKVVKELVVPKNSKNVSFYKKENHLENVI